MMDLTADGFVHRAMDRRARQVAGELHSGLLNFDIISRVAPMLGYLGTVIALLVIVQHAVHPSAERVVSVAASRGIYFSLVPILFGLSVGMLARTVGQCLEMQADTLTAQIIEPEPEVAVTPGVLGFVERAMECTAKLVGLELDRRLHHLALIASVAPLLGIYGTVHSELFNSFQPLGTDRTTGMAHVYNGFADSLLWT